MQKHDLTLNAQNPNARTIEVLQQMLDYYTRTADTWRTIAYRKAISALRKQSKKILNSAKARKIRGIGQRLGDKIEEIVVTNRLRRLDNTSNTAEDRLLQEFLGIYGAGLSQASQWIAQGYKSLEDLQTKATLTKPQKIGIERYYDFSQRIPRSEVQEHGDFVRRVVQKENPDMQVIIGGSYRRGAANSGDIDLLITRPDATIAEIRTLMLDIVVPQLFEQGFLQVGLATTSRIDGSKWHGASKLPNGKLWRRIDLLFVPGSELGAALIYFTGNDIFNRSIRLLASKKSMRLNQRGLFADVLRGPQRAKLNEGRLLEGRDERRIFELLGVPWRPPEHRIP
jgi:DNA polymerase IV